MCVLLISTLLRYNGTEFCSICLMTLDYTVCQTTEWSFPVQLVWLDNREGLPRSMWFIHSAQWECMERANPNKPPVRQWTYLTCTFKMKPSVYLKYASKAQQILSQGLSSQCRPFIWVRWPSSKPLLETRILQNNRRHPNQTEICHAHKWDPLMQIRLSSSGLRQGKWNSSSESRGLQTLFHKACMLHTNVPVF